MNLPRAVREQAERAEAAHQALLGNTAPPAPVVPVNAPVVPPAPVEAPVAPVAPAPAEAPVAPVEPVAAPVAATPDSWELKYRVLNGKYSAEVPRLAAQVRELTEQLRIAQTTPAAVPAPAPVNANTPESVREQYGDDFASAVDAIATARAREVQQQLSTQVQGIEVSTSQRARHDFMRDLGTLVPNFAAIDREPGFTAYLDEFDALAGRPRREFFNEADRANDAQRVAAFFASYVQGQARASAPAPQPPAPPAPAPAPSVDHLIAPSSSRASEAPPGKKFWTRAEIAAFYRDSRASGGNQYGRYSAAEYARIDADISAAAGEHRIGA